MTHRESSGNSGGCCSIEFFNQVLRNANVNRRSCFASLEGGSSTEAVGSPFDEPQTESTSVLEVCFLRTIDGYDFVIWNTRSVVGNR